MVDSEENYKFDRGGKGFRKLINPSYINLLTAINDQDIISPYNIKTISKQYQNNIKTISKQYRADK